MRLEGRHPTNVSPDAMIGAMSLGHGDGTARSKGHISNKTLYIALNYQEQADLITSEAREKIVEHLIELEREQEKLAYYITLLNDQQQETVIVRFYFEGRTWSDIARELHVVTRTVHKIKNRALNDFFTYAQGRYKLPCNPTLSTTRPEVVHREMRVLSPDEMQIFIEEVMKETQRIAILTDLFVGYRIGELLALEISDFNPRRQTLTVNKNLLRVSTNALSLDNPNVKILNYNPAKKTHLIIQSTPKTKSSNRETAISDGLCELLIRHIFTMAHSDWPNPNNLLFPSTKGTYLDPKSFEIRLKAVSKRCEIKKVNPHALRHTLATRLVEGNVPLNIVQGILGHASIETTRKYLHGNEEIEREAIGTMTDYLDVERLVTAPQLNGTRKRGKFADVQLPDFSTRTVPKKERK